MIKAVLFDYGGVMSDGGKGVELTKRISQNLAVSKERAFELLDIGWTLYANGKISEDEFWRQLEAAYGESIAPEKRMIWNAWDVMKPRPEMLEFVKELRANHLQVGLVSNVIPYTMEQIRSHGVYDSFEFTILSAEVGCGKPDIEIYQLALEKLPGIKPEAIIFIDDLPQFLDPARELGLQCVLAATSTQVIADVNALIEERANT